MERLLNKVALVTGGALGIGRAISKLFAAEGATVVIVDIDRDAGPQVVNEIRDDGGRALFFRGDVSDPLDTEGMVRFAIESLGQLDILCANAGIFPETPLERMREAEWDRVLDVNLKSVFLSVKACLPDLQRQSTARILITSSITGNRTAISGLTHYAASKGGINGFIRAAALELATYNITVNGVEPGNVLTEGMESQLGGEYIKAQAEAIPLGRMARPEDIAYAMLFLASEEAAYITGQTIVVDGGQTLPESRAAI